MMVRLFALIFGILSLAQTESTAQNARWNAKGIVVDGSSKDWTDGGYMDENSLLIYSAYFDSTNLYICMKTAAEPSQIKILTKGLVLWIDSTGKKSEKVGIRYPIGGALVDPKMSGGTYEAMVARRNTAIQQKLDYQLLGLDGKKVAPNDVKAAIAVDSSGVLIYEVSFPLALLNLKIPKDAKKPKLFSIGFAGEGLPAKHQALDDMTDDGTRHRNAAGNGGSFPGANNMPNGGTSMPGSMGAGMPGAATPGGGMPPPSKALSPYSTSFKFWQKFYLSK